MKPMGAKTKLLGTHIKMLGMKGQMRRGLLEPLEGDIQTSGGTSATLRGYRSNFRVLMPNVQGYT